MMSGQAEKQAREAFRVSQYGGPSGRPVTSTKPPQLASSSSTEDVDVQPDHQRVIACLDLDCFYASCEEVRDPSLRGRPVGVTQKYLVVTANYPARAAGVGKLMNIKDAVKACPDLVLVPGEDLTPYRAASRAVLGVLSRYGPACRLGLDEVFVDITQVVLSRIHASGRDPSASVPATSCAGHVHVSGTALRADTRWRPQDLRVMMMTHHHPTGGASTASGSEQCAGPQQAASASPLLNHTPMDHEMGGQEVAVGQVSAAAGSQHKVQEVPLILAVGSQVVAEARAAVLAETGLKCSAGVGCNRLLAKLCSGLHKPNDQTVLPPCEAYAFVGPLPVRALPGIGFKLSGELGEMGVTQVHQLRPFTKPAFIQRFGERVGAMLWGLCRGLDPTPITPQGPPKAITTEDSFKSCTTMQAAQAVLEVLVPDLLSRLYEDCEEFRRAPHTLTLKWRIQGSGYHRTSASCQMPLLPTAFRRAPSAPVAPPAATAPGVPAWVVATSAPAAGGGVVREHAAALVQCAMAMLQRNLSPPFNLSLLNIGATNFKDLQGSAAASSGAAARFFMPRTRGPPGGAVPRTDSAAGPPSQPGQAPSEHAPGEEHPDQQLRQAGKRPRAQEDASEMAGQSPSKRVCTNAGQHRAIGAANRTTGMHSPSMPLRTSSSIGAPDLQLQQALPAGDGGMAGMELEGWVDSDDEASLQPTGQPFGPAPCVPPPPPPLPSLAIQGDAAAQGVCPEDVAAVAARATAARRDYGSGGLAGGQLMSKRAERAARERGLAAQGGAGAAAGGAAANKPQVVPPGIMRAALPPPPPPTEAGLSVHRPLAAGPPPVGWRAASAPAPATQQQGYTPFNSSPPTPGPMRTAVSGPPQLQSTHLLHPPLHQQQNQAGPAATHGGTQHNHHQGVSYPASAAATTPMLTSAAAIPEVRTQYAPSAGRGSSARTTLQHLEPPLFYVEEDWDEGEQAGVWEDQGEQQEVGGDSSAGASHYQLPGLTHLFEPEPSFTNGSLTAASLAPEGEATHLNTTASEHTTQVLGPSHGQLTPQGCAHRQQGETPGSSRTPCTSHSAPDTASLPLIRPSTPGQLKGRVVLHVDVDSFYVAVERLDDPSLRGVPVAVKQFNSGGFVSVSYEARAAGIRCGDGAGAGARAVLPHLVAISAVSVEEALRRCPGLQVRPMRTDRYRQVAEQVAAVLMRFAPGGALEKSSYDDYYIDLSGGAGSAPGGGTGNTGEDECQEEGDEAHQEVHAGSDQGPPSHVHVVGGGTWSEVGPSLREGVQVACALRAALAHEFGGALTASVGVATNKLLARLAGPVNKPDAVSVLPPSQAVSFIGGMRIKAIPSLRGKAGDEVVEKLGVTRVGDLARFSAAELRARCGEVLGTRLSLLPRGCDDNAQVKPRGPQKQLLVERSSPPLTRYAAVRAALEPLVAQLWARIVEDSAQHSSRTPTKLGLTFRQSYGSPRSRSGDTPAQLAAAVRAAVKEKQAAGRPEDSHMPGSTTQETPHLQSSNSKTQQPQQEQMPQSEGTIGGYALGTAAHTGVRLLLEHACFLFKAAVGTSLRSGLQVTRLAVSVSYAPPAVTAAGAPGASGQPRISSFTARPGPARPPAPTAPLPPPCTSAKGAAAATAATVPGLRMRSDVENVTTASNLEGTSLKAQASAGAHMLPQGDVQHEPHSTEPSQPAKVSLATAAAPPPPPAVGQPAQHSHNKFAFFTGHSRAAHSQPNPPQPQPPSQPQSSPPGVGSDHTRPAAASPSPCATAPEEGPQVGRVLQAQSLDRAPDHPRRGAAPGSGLQGRSSLSPRSPGPVQPETLVPVSNVVTQPPGHEEGADLPAADAAALRPCSTARPQACSVQQQTKHGATKEEVQVDESDDDEVVIVDTIGDYELALRLQEEEDRRQGAGRMMMMRGGAHTHHLGPPPGRGAGGRGVGGNSNSRGRGGRGGVSRNGPTQVKLDLFLTQKQTKGRGRH